MSEQTEREVLEALPPEVIAQLTIMPEVAPGDFTCAICQGTTSNQWHYSPRDFERPPICRRCENDYTVTGYSYKERRVQPPRHGSFRDRREAMRLYAIADAIQSEAARKKWNDAHAS